MTDDGLRLDDLLRGLAPRAVGALVRRYGHFDSAEDAVQEALLAAARQWPADGVPDRPLAWLIRVASRRLTDLVRAESARRRREDTVASWTLPAGGVETGASGGFPGAFSGGISGGGSGGVSGGSDATNSTDDTLILLMMCCHPSLSAASQIALTLRAVGGLSTGEIARAFLTSETSMARRISRAKRTIQDSGVPFRLPPAAELDTRFTAVLHTLYLIFTEGYASTSGPDLHRPDLVAEAIRLAELAHASITRAEPSDGAIPGAQNAAAGTADARNVDARNVDARNVDARNADARNVDARNPDTPNVDARNADARNVDARIAAAREAAGLVALMVLTDARTPARTTDAGELIPLRDQDRSRWKADSVRRGLTLLARTLPTGPVGPYQLQAAIAAAHATATSEADTDWPQIVRLYRLLLRVAPNPVAALNHAVAVAMVDGPAEGLRMIDELDDVRLKRDHRVPAARAHLLERQGEITAAIAAFRQAADWATNLPHARYLNRQADRLRRDPSAAAD